MEPQELGTVNSPKAQEGDLVNHFILFTSKSHRPAQCPPGNIYSFLEKMFWQVVAGCSRLSPRTINYFWNGFQRMLYQK